MVIEVTFDTTDVYISTTVSPVYVNVSFEAPSGGGGAVWGDITGTLSDQTDLQTALDGKFDDPTGTSLQYIDGTGALQTFPLTLPVLQQVRNQTGGTLAVGTVVYISGATGNLPTVTKAIATGDATSAQTLGMVSAAIANNGTGYVVVIGTCSGLDTSAYTEGQQLYLSYTTAGAVTTTKPYAPNHLVYVGIVTRSHPTLGTVEVRVQNGYELDEIHDVDALNPNNNDGIFYNSTTSLWEHKQISTALGYTPANAATTLTINGVTYDLSANRSWTISAGISGSGASGQVSYWDGTTSQAGSNNLFWDNANGRLRIGSNTTSSALTVTGNYYGSGEIIFSGNSRLTFASPDTYFDSGYNSVSSAIIFRSSSSTTERMRLFGTGNLGIGTGATDGGQRLQVQGTTLLNGNVTFSSATGMFWDAANSALAIGGTTIDANIALQINSAKGVRISGSGGGFGYSIVRGSETTAIANNSSASILASTNTIIFQTASTEAARFNSSQRLLIGSTTDSGERLQVTGNVKVVGSGATSATTALTVQNSSSTNLFLVDNAGTLKIGTRPVEIFATSDGSTANAFGRGLIINTSVVSQAGVGALKVVGSYSATSGADYGLWNSHQFAPTSGTATHSTLLVTPTINQTGGANGITRGLYINPTLTAAADFRAIETTNGKVIFGNLPTSSAGLPTGAIWNNGGVINIV